MLPLRALRPLREETLLPHATDAKVAKRVSIADDLVGRGSGRALTFGCDEKWVRNIRE